VLGIIGCSKPPESTLEGYWKTDETIYQFGDVLTVFSDGDSDTYDYSVRNDSIYLDYGIPFKIELLSQDELILSKRSGEWYMAYQFVRIDG